MASQPKMDKKQNLLGHQMLIKKFNKWSTYQTRLVVRCKQLIYNPGSLAWWTTVDTGRVFYRVHHRRTCLKRNDAHYDCDDDRLRLLKSNNRHKRWWSLRPFKIMRCVLGYTSNDEASSFVRFDNMLFYANFKHTAFRSYHADFWNNIFVSNKVRSLHVHHKHSAKQDCSIYEHITSFYSGSDVTCFTTGLVRCEVIHSLGHDSKYISSV